MASSSETNTTRGDGGKAYPSAGILAVTNAPPIYKSVDELTAYFGDFGGRFIPETLMEAHTQLEQAYVTACQDPAFREEFEQLGKDFIGRPTPMYHAKRLSSEIGGAQIWFKREDLAHTGAHKINNALGQALLAKRLGKQRIIAETGAGQHGVATATACAHLNLDCTVYMGAVDVQRQALNVFRMKMLGAKVVPVRSGSATLKDAINEALRDWVTNVDSTHYIIGSAIGPHPFPTIVKDLQSVIGRESRVQMLEQTGKLPHTVVACVGGGSNAIGMFAGFVDDKEVQMHGVEAGGHGVPGLVAVSNAVAEGGSATAATGVEGGDGKHEGVEVAPHSATITAGRPGVLHGTRTLLLQDKAGQIIETHSISAGLDYPGVGPEHAHLAATGRVQYSAVTDREALSALIRVSQVEGIIPALEPSHALFHALRLAATSRRNPEDIILINLCGRGDKDMQQVAEALGVDLSDGRRTQATEVTPEAALAADTGAAKRSAVAGGAQDK